MKDLLIGMVVGVVTGYVLRKMEDDGKFRCLHLNKRSLYQFGKPTGNLGFPYARRPHHHDIFGHDLLCHLFGQ